MANASVQESGPFNSMQKSTPCGRGSVDRLRRSRMGLAVRLGVARTTCCPGPKDKSKGDSGLLRFAHGHKYPCHPGTYVTMHPKWAMLLFLQQINKHLITADLPRPIGGVFTISAVNSPFLEQKINVTTFAYLSLPKRDRLNPICRLFAGGEVCID